MTDSAKAPPQSRLHRILIASGWTLFLLATLLLFLDDLDKPQASPVTSQFPLLIRLLIAPWMLAIQWAALHTFHEPIRQVIRRIKLPALALYLLFGFFLSNVLGNSFAVQFGLDGDLHPTNPWINLVLYIGPYGGVLLAWYLLRKRYHFDQRLVFWVCGILGLLVEQHGIVPLTLLAGNLIGVLVLTPVTFVAYAVSFASIWVVMPPERLPQGARAVRTRSLGLIVPVIIAAFYVGAGVWYALSDVFLGTNYIPE